MLCFTTRAGLIAALVTGALSDLGSIGARPAFAQDVPRGAPEVIRGHVVDDSARAVPGVTVIVTRGPDRLVRQTTADADGRFSVTFEAGTGDYLVVVSAPGFVTARRRVQRLDSARPGGAGELVADFRLARGVATLAGVQVRGRRAAAYACPRHQAALGLRAGTPAAQGGTGARPLRGPVVARAPPSCAAQHDRDGVSPAPPAARSLGAGDTPGGRSDRRRSQRYRPCVAPSSRHCDLPSDCDVRRVTQRFPSTDESGSGGVELAARQEAASSGAGSVSARDSCCGW
jgi:hypothetical protein